MFSVREIDAVRSEVQYAEETWGREFDDKNTMNDWVTYITMYASDAAKIVHMDDQDYQYRMMIKVAGLALNAAQRIRTNDISDRHYDADRSLNPVNYVHGEGKASSLE